MKTEFDNTENEALNKTDVRRSFFGRSSKPKFNWDKDFKSFNLNFFECTKFRLWLYISKFEKRPLHFCLIIGGLITLDTAHIGKKIYGRLNLTRLFGKDFHIYSSGEGVQSSNYA